MVSYKYKSEPLVRETWIKWDKKQLNSKPSRLTSCEDLDDVQKENDQLIGEAVEEMSEQSKYNKTAGDLIGYTTLKLKVLQVAAQELLDAWKVNGDTGDYAQLIQAVGHLADAMKQTKVGRRTEERRNL